MVGTQVEFQLCDLKIKYSHERTEAVVIAGKLYWADEPKPGPVTATASVGRTNVGLPNPKGRDYVNARQTNVAVADCIVPRMLLTKSLSDPQPKIPPEQSSIAGLTIDSYQSQP